MWLVSCLAVLVLARTVESDKQWEFGYESRFLVVVDIIHGQISQQEKITRIPIQVPKCFDMKHVFVVVKNNISVPDVTYNKENETVKISYKPLQISRSEYDITAKGKRSPKCSEEEIRHLWGGGGGCFVEIEHETGKNKGGCGYGYGDGGGGGGYYDWQAAGNRRKRNSKKDFDTDCFFICQSLIDADSNNKKTTKKKKRYSTSSEYSDESSSYSSSYSSDD